MTRAAPIFPSAPTAADAGATSPEARVVTRATVEVPADAVHALEPFRSASSALHQRRIQMDEWKVVPADPTGAGDYDYTYADEDTSLEYRLRGARGSYVEVCAGDVTCGTLSLMGPGTVEVNGGRHAGLKYQGVDQAGEGFYFFGDADLEGSYLVAAYSKSDPGMERPFVIVPAQRVWVRRP